MNRKELAKELSQELAYEISQHPDHLVCDPVELEKIIEKKLNEIL